MGALLQPLLWSSGGVFGMATHLVKLSNLKVWQWHDYGLAVSTLVEDPLGTVQYRSWSNGSKQMLLVDGGSNHQNTDKTLETQWLRLPLGKRDIAPFLFI